VRKGQVRRQKFFIAVVQSPFSATLDSWS